jgi:Mrp family chromosome partitioning ATPase/capsular polysaccharide biosynthesis protein
VTCIVVVGLGTYLGSKLVTPVYQSTALIRVDIHSSSNSADYDNLLASNQLVQTEAALATSNPVMQEAVSRYPDLTADQLVSKTTATPKLNTQLFEINVQDANAARAAVLANDIAAALIRQQVQEVGQQNTQSQQQLQQDSDATNKSINDVSTKITNAELKIAGLTAHKDARTLIAALQLQITGSQSQLNSLQQHYSQNQMLLTQLEMTEAQDGNFLYIVQSAQPAVAPVQPQIFLNTALGLGAGLFLGLMIAILLEQLDTRVRTSEDVAQLLDWPVLGVTWLVDTAKEKQEVLINPKIPSMNAESYRIMRTNIGFLSAVRPVRSLMVTSAMPYDGKTTVASNLAIFMARAEKNTLLIDADLHRPMLHKEFSLPHNAKGLSDAIVACSQQLPASSMPPAQPEAAETFLDTYMHSVGIPNLRVIPAGSLPPSPSELLDSVAMDTFLATIMKSGIEVVIFDTPPLLGLADASILAAKVDGTAVVVDVMRVQRKNLQQVKTLLTQSGTRVLGCIVNKQRRTRGENPYYYYDHHVDEEEEKKPSHNGHTSVLVSLLSQSEQKDQAK